MPKAETFRFLVETRAGGFCEYCRLHQTASGVKYHLEHIFPKSLGGATQFSNLALACAGCNLAKSDRPDGEDDDGNPQAFFNPRDYDPWLLGWLLHFRLDRETGLIIPLTVSGQATVNCLRMNDSLRVPARKILIRIGMLS
jgi:hypothetical protein